MALRHIPERMLHDTATFYVVSGMDRYQEKTYDTYDVTHVHLQNDTSVIKSTDNEEVQLKGILFVDGRRSTPQLDYTTLQASSLAEGDTMRVVVTDASGRVAGDFAVMTVDGVPDVPATSVHHWELGLV